MFDDLEKSDITKTSNQENGDPFVPIVENVSVEPLINGDYMPTISSNANNNINVNNSNEDCTNRNEILSNCCNQLSGDNDTVLPDVTCVTNTHYASVHSYGSNQDGENQPLLRRFDSDSGGHIINNTFPDDPEFNALIRDVEQAIEDEILPQRISQGSSGSYFVKNSDGNVCLLFVILIFINLIL